jgi:hypothetical protein
MSTTNARRVECELVSELASNDFQVGPAFLLGKACEFSLTAAGRSRNTPKRFDICSQGTADSLSAARAAISDALRIQRTTNKFTHNNRVRS